MAYLWPNMITSMRLTCYKIMCMCYMQLELVGGPETQNTKVGPDRVGKCLEWKLSILPTNRPLVFGWC